jgi:prepilin-type N-terminal cleavage/methylation domain-containing protein
MSPDPLNRLQKPTNAFTLVELLVVIAIIGVLVAMFLPALGRAKAQAERLACATNERSMVVCVAAYSADFRQYCPTFTGGVVWQINGNPQQWNGTSLYYVPGAYGYMLKNYASTYRMGMCPAQFRRLVNISGAHYWYQTTMDGAPTAGYASYDFLPNLFLTWQNYNIVGYAGMKSAWKMDEDTQYICFGGPSYLASTSLPFNKFILFADQINGVGEDNNDNAAYAKTCHLESGRPTGGNVAFGDGAVAWHKFDGYNWYGPTGASNINAILPREWSYDVQNVAYWMGDYFAN